MSYRQFSELFGATRANTDLVGVARNAARNGFAMVAVRPGTKAPVCILTDTARRKADKEAAAASRNAGHRAWSRVRHPCGRNHAVTDPDVAARVFRRLVTRWPDTLNLAIEVGRSQMLLVDCDSAAGVQEFTALWADRDGIPDLATAAPTVRTPGKVHEKTGEWTHKDGGHFWFSLPDGVDFSDATVPPVYGDEFVIYFRDTIGLVPPSHRPEGAYQLASESGEAPGWLVAMVREHIEAATSQRRERRTTVLADGDPIDTWAASNTWEEILLPDGWEQTGRWSRCGCEEWTRPGEDWSNPKSATAHEVGCTEYDTSSGHAPLHLWTDSPPEFLATYVERTGRKTLTKLTYLAWRDHDGDAAAAMTALGVQARGADYVSDDEVFEMTQPGAQTEQEPEEAFWSTSNKLAQLERFSRARRVPPWAMLGAVLATVASRIGPHVVLPPPPAKASLNLLVALVGDSGGTKTSTVAAVKEYLWLDDAIPEHEIGTGQGVTSAYTRPPKKDVVVNFCDSALWLNDEIGSLAAHASMKGANLISVVKSAYSGARLGSRYADDDRRRPVKPHHYRFALISGVQPVKAGVILEDADGGFPQRWLWLPATDPGAPEVRPATEQLTTTSGGFACPVELAAQGVDEQVGVARADEVEVKVCQQAQDEVDAALLDRLRGRGDPMASHRNLTRLKVAALLAIWHGRVEVEAWEWETARQIMTVSDTTRNRCEQAVAAKQAAGNRARARDEVERETLKEEATLKRVATKIYRALERQSGEWVAHSQLRKNSLTGRDRDVFGPAVERLLAAGRIEQQETEQTSQGHGGPGARYRVTKESP